MKKITLVAFLVLGLFIGRSLAAEVTLLGPKQYFRTAANPTIYTDSFPGFVGTGKLILMNGTQDGQNRISSAIIKINGTQVLWPRDFNQQVYAIETPVNLAGNNSISIELRSNPGGYITIKVVQEVTADAAAVIGSVGGTITASNGIQAFIPQGATDNSVVVAISYVPPDQLRIDPSGGLGVLGAVNFNIGDAVLRINAELTIPKPSNFSASSQIYLGKIIALNEKDLIVMADTASVQGNLITTNNPAIYGALTSGTFAFYKNNTVCGVPDYQNIFAGKINPTCMDKLYLHIYLLTEEPILLAQNQNLSNYINNALTFNDAVQSVISIADTIATLNGLAEKSLEELITDSTTEMSDAMATLYGGYWDIGALWLPLITCPITGSCAQELAVTVAETWFNAWAATQAIYLEEEMNNNLIAMAFFDRYYSYGRNQTLVAQSLGLAPDANMDSIVKEVAKTVVNDPWWWPFSSYDVTKTKNIISTGEQWVESIYKALAPRPIIISSLQILPAEPYGTFIGEFKIENRGAIPITLDVLTIGGRDPNGQVSDFPWDRNVVFEPFSFRQYANVLTLSKVGTYHFFTAYRTMDGQWNTSIPVAEGVTNTLDILVNQLPPPNQSPTAGITMSAQGQTVYENGTLNLSVVQGETVTVSFSASRSSDPDGSITSYQWYISRQPVNTSRDFNFGLGAGTHQIFLEVWDNLLAKGAVGAAVIITVQQQNQVPNPPTVLHQFKSDGITPITAGSTTNESVIILKGNLSDPDGDQVKLQIELRRTTETFSGIVTYESSFIPSGSTATIFIAGLTNGAYQWHGRTMDTIGNVSAWVDAGFTGADFVVQLAIPISSWAKSYGTMNWDYAQTIDQTADGGYITLGSSNIYECTNDGCLFKLVYPWAIKLDTSGNIQWQKAYGSSSIPEERLYFIHQTSDGGYIAAGTIQKDQYTSGGWAVKLDPNGNIQWQKSYGESNNNEQFGSIRPTMDGGYIAAGHKQIFSYRHNRWIVYGWVVKLDSNGNIEWQKAFGDNESSGGNSFFYSAQTTPDNGFIVTGSTEGILGAVQSVWVMKLDSNGNIQWQKAYGEYEETRSIRSTLEGGYIVVGKRVCPGENGWYYCYPWVLKLDSNGNIQWHKSYGDGWLYSICPMSDGGYIAAGSTSLNYAGAIKLDSNGNIQWQKDYYVYNVWESSINSVQTTLDGGYIAAGSLSKDQYGIDYDAWILKINSDGTVPPLGLNTDIIVEDANVTVMLITSDVINTSIIPKDTFRTVTEMSLTVTQQAP